MKPTLLRLLIGLYVVTVVVALASLMPSHSWHRARAGVKSGSLAIVRISGAIRINETPSAWGAPDAEDIAKQLHRLSENDDVKAIVLRINSPGGTVAAVQEIQTEILRCKSKGKKIIVSMGDVAASGGYYLASGGDRVFADSGTITGSIGVILEFGNVEGLMQKLGVKLEVIKSGAHKDIGSPARALTAEERQLLQASIDDAYGQFVDAVSQGRHLPVDKVRVLADGRIFTGRQAQQSGLVDELGGREDAIAAAIRLAGLPEKPRIISDSSRSLSSLVRHLSSRMGIGLFESVEGDWHGPRLEYRWQ